MPRKKIENTANPEVAQGAPEEVAPQVPPKEEAQPVPEPSLPEGLEGEGIKVKHFNPGGDAEAMFKHLSSQPKVPFFIPLGWGEKEGAEQWIQLNSLGMTIKKNMMVLLPKQVADVLLESLHNTSEALNPFVVNGDGRVVRAQSGIGRPELNR